jgi:hypothetical protein
VESSNLDVNGDGDVNADDLDARGALHATRSEMTTRDADIAPGSLVLGASV